MLLDVRYPRSRIIMRALTISALLLASPLVAGCSPTSEEASTCAPGEPGCACTSSLTCDEGLVCVDVVCVEEREWFLLHNSGARGCDILLESPAHSVVREALFDGHLLGQSAARGRRFALSFARRGRGLPTSDTMVRLRGGGDPPAIVRATCFDESGGVLPTAEVSLR